MTRSLRFWLWLVAAIVSFNVVLGSGLIAEWGKWYSAFMPYRRQTDALLSGRIALSSSPTAVEHDMAWAEGGVQQVWGLGVPCWRLPFEAIARLFGQPAFPDRLALAVAILVVSYLILRVFSAPIHVRNFDDWLIQLARFPVRAAAAFILILFPPLITMCSGPFNVYEEAVVYGYYYAVALFAATIAFAQRPTLQMYLAVSLFAGLAAFVRPTIGAYGFSTMAIIWLITRQAGWSWWKSLLGPTLFGLGCALLFGTNLKRFGSGFEFGHQLTLSAPDLMYFLRFPTPFNEEPVWSAAKELFGSVFFVRTLNGFDVYREGIVAWQSATPRWRHFYHTTFDWSFLLGIIACWVWGALDLFRARKEKFKSADRDLLVSAAWSFVSTITLAAFYLRLTAMSSRYVLDFAPGICAAFVGCLLGCENKWFQVTSASKLLRNGLLAALAGWWIYEIAIAEHAFPPTPTFTQDEVLAQMQWRFPDFQSIPALYVADASPSEVTGIPQNGLGWTHPSGQVGMMVVLFVSDPEELRLEVAPAEGKMPMEEQYAAIRAKVGLEFLDLESVEPTEQGRVLTFSAPKREAYRHGIQVVFLAFLSSDEFLQGTSPFQLLRVDWASGDITKSDVP